MEKTNRNAILTFFLVVIIGILVAIAGSQGGSTVGSIPVFALAVGLIFLIQWLVFIPAYRLQSEKFYDLTGSLTYISIITMSLILSNKYDARSILLWAMVVVWAGRLGTFLFRRVRSDSRNR